MHAKLWVNGRGGTRTSQLNEKLVEFNWRRDYYKNDGLNVWRTLVLIARTGNAALEALNRYEARQRIMMD